MKKPVILFAVVFAVMAWFFISAGVDKVHLHSAIAKAPAYAPATPEAIKEKKSKRSTNYSVIFGYQVGGSAYKVESESVSQEQAARALAMTPDMEVAYVQGAPDKALLRSEFDRRDKSESVFGAVVTEAGSALLFSVVVALVLSWKFGWLRRRPA